MTLSNIQVYGLYDSIQSAGLPLVKTTDELPSLEEIEYWLKDDFVFRFIEYQKSGQYPKFTLYKSHATMTVKNKLNKNVKITIDIEDIPKLMGHNWIFLNYTFSRDVGLLHRYLMSDLLIDDNKHLIDHINGDVHDNRKCNLRLATRSQNSANCKKRSNNTSGITGVAYDDVRHQWKASINYKKKNIFIGRFDSQSEAIYARLEKEKKLFGAFAPQRHLFEDYGLGAVTAQVTEAKFNNLELVIKLIENFKNNISTFSKSIIVHCDVTDSEKCFKIVSESSDKKIKHAYASYFDILDYAKNNKKIKWHLNLPHFKNLCL